MYQNFQSVIVDLFIVTSFLVQVSLALGGISKSFQPLALLLNKGVADLIFNQAKKVIYALLFVALIFTLVVTWRFYEILTFFEIVGWGKYILVSAFTIYSFTFLGIFIFCKLLLMTGQRSGI